MIDPAKLSAAEEALYAAICGLNNSERIVEKVLAVAEEMATTAQPNHMRAERATLRSFVARVREVVG